jgi:hypothetical protein
VLRAFAFASILVGLSLPGLVAARADKEDDRPSQPIPGLKSKVIELRHRSPEDVMRVVRPLASGAKGTSLSESNEFKTITVRDYPEHLATIEEAIKRLDVPAPVKPDVELTLRALIAAPSGPSNVPGDLGGVVKQLRSTLNYKSYNEILTITKRMQQRGAKGKSPAQIGPPVTAEPSTLSYAYGFEDINVGTGNNPQIQIRKLFFWMGNNKHLGEADVSTGITLKEGDKVVVGTESLKDRALILVLSARVIR